MAIGRCDLRSNSSHVSRTVGNGAAWSIRKMVDDFYNITMERATILIAQNQPMLDIEKLRESAHLLVYALSESDLLAVT